MLVTPGPGLLGKLFVGKLGTNGPAEREREEREGISPLYYTITVCKQIAGENLLF